MDDNEAEEVALPGFTPAAIAFPTDAITFGAMRRNESWLDDLNAHSGDVAANEVFSSHRFELYIARKAFAKARGLPDPDASITREEIVDLLHRVYRKFGLVKGMHTTRQLIQDIETAAVAQAAALGL